MTFPIQITPNGILIDPWVGWYLCVRTNFLWIGFMVLIYRYNQEHKG